MGPGNNFVHFKHVCWFLLIKSWSSFQHSTAQLNKEVKTRQHSPLNVEDSTLWILYMLKQLLISSLIEVMKPGCWGHVEFIMTLSPIHWVPVQDKWLKILCVKLGAMKVTQSDPLHQENLTINLGSTKADKAEVSTSEALWEMDGQMLARRSSLGQRMQEEEQCAATSLFRHCCNNSGWFHPRIYRTHRR